MHVMYNTPLLRSLTGVYKGIQSCFIIPDLKHGMWVLVKTVLDVFIANISITLFMCTRQLTLHLITVLTLFMQIKHPNPSQKASNCLGRHTQPDICPEKEIY